MTSAELTKLAERWAKAGLSVIPVKEDKRPAVKAWKHYQEAIATKEAIAAWKPKALAVVGGQVSGGVECIDIDTKADKTGTLLKALVEALHNLRTVAENCYIQRTPSGGAHIVYRCSSIEGNLKLACTADGATLIETRGEGGYFVAAPSDGYKATNGSLEELPVISPEDRQAILTVCRSFDLRLPAQKEDHRQQQAAKGGPGSEYNETADVGQLLTEAGWRLVYTREGGPYGAVQYWGRPGKEKGMSATLNYTGPNKLHVFSSNAVPFEPGRSYSPFAVLAFLKYGGDFKAAAAWLRSQGLGGDKEDTTARPSGPMRAWLSDNYTFAYNVITGEQFVADKGGPYRLLDDRETNNVYWALEATGIKTSREKLEALINSDFSTKYDPFQDWLDRLPVYDGTDYIQELLETTQPTKADMDIFPDYLKKWMVGHVAQILTGQPNQVVLVLKGRQGITKTTWLNRLCPPELQDYLYIGDIEASSKDSQVLIAERFLVNLDELEGMQRAEIGHLKSLITTQQVTVRRPYAHRAVVLKRKASFCGSVNKDTFLTDTTGNRRFLVVEMEALDGFHGLDINRVWSQAVHLYRAGYKYWLSLAEIDQVNAANEAYRVETVAEELIAYYCEPEYDEERISWSFYPTTKLALELANKVGGKLAANDFFVRQVGQALRKLGYKRVKHDGRYGWLLTWKAGITEKAPF